ncbi:Protein mpe1 [Elasticomyces elasticus]|nr:Protein mpe1 [Elasticomyces elasticus]
MSSSVFFKFKSQKEPQRVTFDGPGITVFELKKDIISISRLGDGTDFDLAIYNPDTNEEYNDDYTMIPRSSSVVARRLPASKPGYGKAAHYVSGSMPKTAKNQHRQENSKTASQRKSPPLANGTIHINNNMTEEEKMAAMFDASAQQWGQTKEQMATAKAIHRGGYKKSVTVPDREPPAGYVCYRCGNKGHWIQSCPTNDDPNFDGRPRIKRTTGIPRSMLTVVGEPDSIAKDSAVDGSKQPSSVMVNAEGKVVIFEPDSKAWEKFQATTKVSAAQQEAAAEGDKELRDRGLECSVDKRMFVDPVKTPCCGKTYCRDCIENALLNSDFVCPDCNTSSVFLDNLVPDDDAVSNIRAFEDEKATVKREKAKSATPPAKNATTPAPVKDQTKSPEAKAAVANPASTSGTPPLTESNPLKRAAESELENNRIPTGPAAMRNQKLQTPVPPPSSIDQQFVQQMDALAKSMPQLQQGTNAFNFPNMNGMGFPNGNPMMGMPTTMQPAMGMMPGMMNPMMMPNNQGWPYMNGMGVGMGNLYGGGFNGGMMPSGGYAQQWQNQPGAQGWGMNGGVGMPQQNQMNMHLNKNGLRPNQQAMNFTGPASNTNGDDAYIRKPVNPHRHQARQRRQRSVDYREM